MSRDGLVQHWDIAVKKRIEPKKSGDREEFMFVTNAVASADGKTLAIADEYSVLVKDAVTGKTLRRFDDVRPDKVTLSSTGKMTAVLGRDDAIVFDTETGKEVARRSVPNMHAMNLAFSSDAKQLAVAAPLAGLAVAGLGKPRPKPAVPLETRLTSRKASYTLDLDGMTPETFAGRVRKPGLPPSPKVDVVLTLRNTGDKKLLLDSSVTVNVHLIGNAAMNHPETPYQTFRLSTGDEKWPKPIALAPGETYSIPIKSLDQGHDRQSYWLRPGDYDLHATAWVSFTLETKRKEKTSEESVFATLEVPPLRVKVVAEKK